MFSNSKVLNRWLSLIVAGLLIAGCSSEPGNEETGAAVIGSTGKGSNVQRFDVRKSGLRMVVQVFNRGQGVRTFAVSTRSYRGLDRSDATLPGSFRAGAGKGLEA